MNARMFCSRDCERAYAREQPVRQVTGSGYIKLFAPGESGANKSGHMLEHRLVMQRHLGRTLLPSENVHHVNGERQDNRLENLELWTTMQPTGQRVSDKLAWAREFIARYEGLEVD